MSKKNNPMVHMRESEFRKVKKENINNGIRYAIILFLSVMRDKEGYGIKRLKRLYGEVEALAESVTNGYVKLTDLEKALEEESSITVGR